MPNTLYSIDPPANEPPLAYMPGSAERVRLEEALSQLKSNEREIPLIIGGQPVKTGNLGDCITPHAHRHRLARYHQAGPDEVAAAIRATRQAASQWAAMDWAERLAIFLKAADLIAGPYRMVLNGVTMLGQGKNIFQAEIDAACEMVDFLRFNAHFANRIYQEQPLSGKAEWNRMDYRPLEGFILAVTPFNFTAIAGNLPTAPAMLGNTVLWKPASSAVYSAWLLMEIFMEAGLPPGVINFIPGRGSQVGDAALASPDLAGVHFTGSTPVFRQIWKKIAANIEIYKSYPRIVGETGGKDFVMVHASADMDAVVAALIRGAFEYQGQKCSAASRAYLPASRWDELKTKLLAETTAIRMGSPEEYDNFVNAVIDETAFDGIKAYIDYARQDRRTEILCGGGGSKETGYFIEPTIILTRDPEFRTMREEIFGPVLTIYVYPDENYLETLSLCDRTSPYALTGAVFARDRHAIAQTRDVLVHAAGNFYINDKPTGAVVGRQPFGGARGSGTNDKAGSVLNLYRWLSPRTIKENFVPPRDFRYPYMLGA